jgi:hypothetical protein
MPADSGVIFEWPLTFEYPPLSLVQRVPRLAYLSFQRFKRGRARRSTFWEKRCKIGTAQRLEMYFMCFPDDARRGGWKSRIRH